MSTKEQLTLIDVLKQIREKCKISCMVLLGLSFPIWDEELTKRLESATISELLQKADLINPDQSSWIKILGRDNDAKSS